MFIWSCNHCRSTNPYAAVLSPFHLGWSGGATSSPGCFSLALEVGREKNYLVIFLHKLPKSINQSKWRIDRPMPWSFPAPPPKPGKSALGTRLVEWRGYSLWWPVRGGSARKGFFFQASGIWKHWISLKYTWNIWKGREISHFRPIRCILWLLES